MNQLRLFLHAVEFLTRVPVRPVKTLDPDWLIRSAKYFPLVGLLVGMASAAVLLLASELWGGALPALLAITASILLTGALHEDGLADTADGLGGGWTPERRLAIMKDSRLGTYGGLALGLGTALRVAALAAMPAWIAAAALIAAHAGGRLAGILVMNNGQYAGDPADGKVVHSPERLRGSELLLALLLAGAALLPLMLIGLSATIMAVAVGALLAVWIARLARRLIGGYTGDVLGAAEQLFEIGFLLAVAAALSP